MMKKIILVLTAVFATFISIYSTIPQNVNAESGSTYDISEVSTIAPGGELEFYNLYVMNGTKKLNVGDSVSFAMKMPNHDKVLRAAIGIGCYGFYFHRDAGGIVKFLTCNFVGDKLGRGNVIAQQDNASAFDDYVGMVLKTEAIDGKIRLTLTYMTGGEQFVVSYDYDKDDSSDMLMHFGDNGINQYSEVYIKSLLETATFGDGSFTYVNYNNNAGKNVSGKCMLGVVAKDVAEKYGAPTDCASNMLKIEGLTPTGSLDMSFDFTSKEINRSRILSFKFRIYVCKTSADTGSYPALRVLNTGSTSAFTPYVIGNNTNKWVNIEFSSEQIDKLCSNGKLEKFTLWLRTNARTIAYIDSFTLDLVPLDEEAPVINAPITEFKVAAGAYPLDDAVTATDDSGSVTLERIWSDGALDERGRLIAGTHTCKIIATDPSNNKSEVTLTYIVSEEPEVAKYSVIFRFEGLDDIVVEYHEGGEEYFTLPSDIPERTHYKVQWDEFSLEKKQNQVVNGRYIPITYKLTYKADEQIVAAREYKITDGEYIDPEVPAKKGYNAAWSNYEFNQENITVTAEYTAIVYTVEYIADGQKVDVVEYTIEDENITDPAVPGKQYYNGVWTEHSFDCENITVTAVYTPIVYTVTYVADGETVALVEYSIENFNFDIPAVPEKEGYEGKWQEHEFNFENITVNAVYTEKTVVDPDPADSSDSGSGEQSVEDMENCSSSVAPGGTFVLLLAFAVVFVMKRKMQRAE